MVGSIALGPRKIAAENGADKKAGCAPELFSDALGAVCTIVQVVGLSIRSFCLAFLPTRRHYDTYYSLRPARNSTFHGNLCLPWDFHQQLRFIRFFFHTPKLHIYSSFLFHSLCLHHFFSFCCSSKRIEKSFSKINYFDFRWGWKNYFREWEWEKGGFSPECFFCFPYVTCKFSALSTNQTKKSCIWIWHLNENLKKERSSARRL